MAFLLFYYSLVLTIMVMIGNHNKSHPDQKIILNGAKMIGLFVVPAFLGFAVIVHIWTICVDAFCKI